MSTHDEGHHTVPALPVGGNKESASSVSRDLKKEVHCCPEDLAPMCE